jgi:hypothetical protein
MGSVRPRRRHMGARLRNPRHYASEVRAKEKAAAGNTVPTMSRDGPNYHTCRALLVLQIMSSRLLFLLPTPPASMAFPSVLNGLRQPPLPE